MIALEPHARSATIVLGNAASNLTGFGLYVHLPDQEMPSLEKLREIVLLPDQLALMTGEYALSEAESIQISMRDEQLYSEIGSDGAYPVYPCGSDRLFYRIGEARLIFEFQNIGKAATAVTLITPNGHCTGARMESSK